MSCSQLARTSHLGSVGPPISLPWGRVRFFTTPACFHYPSHSTNLWKAFLPLYFVNFLFSRAHSTKFCILYFCLRKSFFRLHWRWNSEVCGHRHQVESPDLLFSSSFPDSLLNPAFKSSANKEDQIWSAKAGNFQLNFDVQLTTIRKLCFRYLGCWTAPEYNQIIFFPERIFLGTLLRKSWPREQFCLVVSTMGFQSLSFEFTKNSSSNENDIVLNFRVIYGYRQLWVGLKYSSSNSLGRRRCPWKASGKYPKICCFRFQCNT